MTPSTATTVTLDGPADVAGFRRAARQLVQAGVAPAGVHWRVTGDAGCLWDTGRQDSLLAAESSDTPGPAAAAVAHGASGAGVHGAAGIGHLLAAGDADGDDGGSPHEAHLPAAPDPERPTFKVPAGFVALCDTVLLHRDAQRFALMYRLLWRLRHEPGFWCDELDPERRRAEHLAREVRRDIHKMRAFVRFTPVDDPDGVRHIAWFEPAHHIVEANATFFMRRFAQMRWAILTPERSVAWDGADLAFGPGAHRTDAPAPDAGSKLWLTYYEHIFNPARLKLDTMAREMPRRYWVNLPEAVLIAPLTAAATARSEAMVAAEPTAPRRTKPMAVPHRALKMLDH